MTDLQSMLSRLRAALAPLDVRTEAPSWSRELLATGNGELGTNDLWLAFAHHLTAVNGTPLRGYTALGRWLRDQGCRSGYCDPSILPSLERDPSFQGIELREDFDRAQVDTYQFGITRGSGAIASTGTVVLKDQDTPSRLAALAPWVHVAIITPAQLHRDVVDALASLGEDPSIIWVTGPSKTADVEGILIEGAHGPGVQAVCLELKPDEVRPGGNTSSP